MTLPDTELQPLLHCARVWADQDPDPVTAAQLRALITLAGGTGVKGAVAGGSGRVSTDGGREAADGNGPAGAAIDGAAGAGMTQDAAQRELTDSFSGSLQFGTAGLRAAMGPGPNRMNRVVVRRAAAGLAAFLLKASANSPRDMPVGEPSDQPATRAEREPNYRPRAVVGFDARHNSQVFAAESAAILTAAGIETFLLPAALPTPVLAYAVRKLNCDAGVMVTASHNPALDNGYKVYLGGRTVTDAGQGAQIVAPFDAMIAAEIAAVGEPASIELATAGWTMVGADFTVGYQDAVRSLADPLAFPSRDVKIVYTPMHGVGGETAVGVLRGAGFENIAVVQQQEGPDPDFPTVAFPNPEEPGALDLAVALARDEGADIVLANDPDADRAAVAALDPSAGTWRMLRGDEVGALLGSHLARRLAGRTAGTPKSLGTVAVDDGGRPGAAVAPGAAGQTGTADHPAVFANSIVSSRLLARIAASHGLEHTQTLTGFKWISRVPGLSYGYEEALGYCIAPEIVRDKDGISAALLIAELAAEAKARGRSIFDTLDDFALAHGLHAGDQLSLRVADLTQLTTMMASLRQHPPTSLGGSSVETFTDLAEGSATLPPTDGLLFRTVDGSRVIIRPSGTEPKLKCYLEVIVPVSVAADLPDARLRARAALDATLADVRAALGL
ncbi:phospho-sugar mutase [Paeniglutamicibacter antarcticus]|uniref:Phospho-sugar mutase n=1 Tax=Arthrobacter terrae TaxID=2935737 RepID=A0A931CJX2_9MICC|nr:phospho-sugar mutase [Arthrobacter terrae]MBG0738362.1 phospho-sugar mutase [Arthrobacter terrae]